MHLKREIEKKMIFMVTRNFKKNPELKEIVDICLMQFRKDVVSGENKKAVNYLVSFAEYIKMNGNEGFVVDMYISLGWFMQRYDKNISGMFYLKASSSFAHMANIYENEGFFLDASELYNCAGTSIKNAINCGYPESLREHEIRMYLKGGDCFLSEAQEILKRDNASRYISFAIESVKHAERIYTRATSINPGHILVVSESLINESKLEHIRTLIRDKSGSD